MIRLFIISFIGGLFFFFSEAAIAAAPPDQNVLKNVHGCVDNVASCTNESAVKNAWSQAMQEASTVVQNMYRFLYDIFSGTSLPTPPSIPATGPIKQATTPNPLVTPMRVTPDAPGK